MFYWQREREWIREPLRLPHKHSKSGMKEMEWSVWDRKVGPSQTRFPLEARPSSCRGVCSEPSLLSHHNSQWSAVTIWADIQEKKENEKPLTLLLTLMVVIVTTKDYTTQLNNSLYSRLLWWYIARLFSGGPAILFYLFGFFCPQIKS